MTSSSKPIFVAITQRETLATDYHEPRDALARDWTRWFSELPGTVLPIALPNDPKVAVDLVRETNCQALIISGGNDLFESIVRDQTEHALLHAYPMLPTLGICRGMQMLAHNTGWSCHVTPDTTHRASRHTLNWHQPTDQTPPAEVNSYHNQVLRVDEAPPEWTVVASSDDGTAEMIEHRSFPRSGIMWHPEREESPLLFDQYLFSRILDSSK